MEALYIPELNVKELTDRIHREYNIKITEIGDRCFWGYDSNLKKIRNPNDKRKIRPDECRSLFDYLEKLAKAQEGKTFDDLMKSWFPELKIYSTTKDIRKVMRMNLMEEILPEEAHIDRYTLIQASLRNELKVRYIKMAYHTGWTWFSESARINLIEEAAKRNIPIQIIVNSEEVIKDISISMSDPTKTLQYKGFDENIEEWHKYEKAYDSISLRISEYPIFRKVCIVGYEDKSEEALIREYTYGSTTNAQSPSCKMTENDRELSFYNKEFDFLWEHSKSYDEWCSSEEKKFNIIGKSKLIEVTSLGQDFNRNSFRFLQSCMKYDSPIKAVNMAYQTGWSWFSENIRMDLIDKIAKKGIPIRIIANPESVIKKIGFSMRDSEKELRYKGFNETLEEWRKYEKAYDSMSLRISDYPVLRKTIIVEFEDGSVKALLRDYNYGVPADDNSPYAELDEKNVALECYRVEFDFLWNHAKTYDEWRTSEPKQEEILAPEKYLLIHSSYKKNNYLSENENSEWCYLALSIEENNVAKLRRSNLNWNDEDIDNADYTYTGSVKLTRKNIFISLEDVDHQEDVNIILLRPLRENSRYIGIITGLNPATGQPVAVKCACINRTSFKNLNVDLLNKLLCGTEKSSSITIIDDEAVNLFYSDKIFTEKAR